MGNVLSNNGNNNKETKWNDEKSIVHFRIQLIQQKRPTQIVQL